MKPMLTKEKDNHIFPALVVAFCFVFAIAGIWFIYEGIENYQLQLDQQDWCESEAFVTQVSSRKESSWSGKKVRTKIVYDIEYIFDVPPMETYYGNIVGSTKYYDTGDVLTIKYDPDNPHDSTTVLEPDLSALITNTVLSLLFVVLPIIILFIQRIKHKSKIVKIKPRCKYSKNDPSVRGYPIKLVLMAMMSYIKIDSCGLFALVGAIFILFAVLADNLVIFYVAGGLSLIMFLRLGVIQPVSRINKLYREIGSEQFYRIVDKALETPRNHYSDYEVIMGDLYKACPTIDD